MRTRSEALGWAAKAGKTSPEEAAAIYKIYKQFKEHFAMKYPLTQKLYDVIEKTNNEITLLAYTSAGLYDGSSKTFALMAGRLQQALTEAREHGYGTTDKGE